MSGWVVTYMKRNMTSALAPVRRASDASMARISAACLTTPAWMMGWYPAHTTASARISSARRQAHVRRFWQLGSPRMVSHAACGVDVRVIPVEMVVEWCRIRTDAMNSRTGRGWSSPPTSTMPLRKKFLHTKHGRHRGQQAC